MSIFVKILLYYAIGAVSYLLFSEIVNSKKSEEKKEKKEKLKRFSKEWFKDIFEAGLILIIIISFWPIVLPVNILSYRCVSNAEKRGITPWKENKK